MRRLILTAACAALLGGPAHAVELDFVLVGDPGNAPDPRGVTKKCGVAHDKPCGDVSYPFKIGKYEVTNAQYAEFLNAKAASDPFGLYGFGTDITRAGSDGTYTYSVVAGRGDWPVTEVPFYAALRFINWLHNGQGAADTETGAYTLNGVGSPAAVPPRNANARFWLPNEDEWYKAAYYAGRWLPPGALKWFSYPTREHATPTCAPGSAASPNTTPNTANCDDAIGSATDIGSYTNSAGPYGTFDQGGNVFEWYEAGGAAGGSWGVTVDGLRADNFNYLGAVLPAPDRSDWIGFRVAAAAPYMEFVLIGNPGNPPDPHADWQWCLNVPCGAVPYTYRIGKYEVTNAQYVEFLNAVDPAGTNTLGLYNRGWMPVGGIFFGPSQPAGSKYVTGDLLAHLPVRSVTWFDAVRFANWMHNGMGAGDTETGAYTLLGGTPVPSNWQTVSRNPGAMVWLPSDAEWYKAAYYDGTSATWFEYPTGSDTLPTCAAGSAASPNTTPNTANCDYAVGTPTQVGSYTNSASPYGTFDQGGNVFEWLENGLSDGSERFFRGGSCRSDPDLLSASQPRSAIPSLEGYPNDPGELLGLFGFRVASAPERRTGAALEPGDIVVASSSSANSLQANVVRIDPDTLVQEVISSGGTLHFPTGLAIDEWGDLFVAEREPGGLAGSQAGAVLRVSPEDGSQEIVIQDPALWPTWGLARDAEGRLLVSVWTGQRPAIDRIEPSTGRRTTLTSHGLLDSPAGLAVDANGEIFAADWADPSDGVLQIDPTSGAQVSFAGANEFSYPQGIAIDRDGDIWITQGGAAERVTRIDAATGAWTDVASGDYMRTPRDIAAEADGQLVVAAFGLEGGVVRVDPDTGDQTQIAAPNAQELLRPTAVLVVPETCANSPETIEDTWCPQESGTDESLKAVWGSGPTDVFAVGAAGTILHYDGAAWTPQQTPTSQGLSSVWGSGPTDVFVVGAAGTILHYDGSQWSLQGSGTSADLVAVCGSAGGPVFIAGADGTVLRHGGGTWTAVSPVSTVRLRDLWVDESGVLHAVGDGGSKEIAVDGETIPIPIDAVFRSDDGGGTWTRDFEAPYEEFFALMGSGPSHRVAVGGNFSDGFYGIIRRRTGGGWSETLAVPPPLHDVWVGDAAEAYAVGATEAYLLGLEGAGAVLHWDGGEWRRQPTGRSAALWGVFATCPSHVFAVGEQGTILHRRSALISCASPGDFAPAGRFAWDGLREPLVCLNLPGDEPPIPGVPPCPPRPWCPECAQSFSPQLGPERVGRKLLPDYQRWGSYFGSDRRFSLRRLSLRGLLNLGERQPSPRALHLERLNAGELDRRVPGLPARALSEGPLAGADVAGALELANTTVGRAGTLSLEIDSGLPALPRGYVPGWPMVTFSPEFSGELSDEQPLEVRIYLGGIDFRSTAARPRLLEWDGTRYRDITLRLDRGKGLLVGRTDALRRYTIMNQASLASGQP